MLVPDPGLRVGFRGINPMVPFQTIGFRSQLVSYFLFCCLTKYQDKNNLREKRLVYAHSSQVPVHHRREVIASEAWEAWSCDSHSQDYRYAGHVTVTVKRLWPCDREQWINACRAHFALSNLQSRISCLGNGSAHSGQVFPPQLDPSRHPQGMSTRQFLPGILGCWVDSEC